jgi:polyhydroxyalkanoate synthesis regulator phasin
MALKLNKKPLDEKEFYQYDGEQSKAVIGDVPLKDTNTSKTPTATPQKTPSSTMSPSKNTASGLTNKAPSLPEYTAPTYQPSEAVNQAAQMLADQMAKAPGQYNSPWVTQLNDTLDKILNREKFSYDFNGDAFYQQFKDKFTQQARMASEDAVARASAMTGGYGNSYAATAGAQAYNAEMQQLNDVIPELYQMAYDRYAREGQDLKDAYSMLAAREAEAYGKYRDEKADYLTERDYLTGRLESEKADDYNRFADERNFGYGANRDTVADKKWQSEFDLAVDQFNKNLELSQQAAIDKATADRNKVVDDIGKELPEKFDNNEDMANHVATLVNRGEITEEEAIEILNKYSYADYKDRDWHIEDIGRDPFGAPGAETIFKDQYGNSVSYVDIMDELIASGMSQEEADKWMLDLLTKLHGNKEWGN